jgi:hypothetical protein
MWVFINNGRLQNGVYSSNVKIIAIVQFIRCLGVSLVSDVQFSADYYSCQFGEVCFMAYSDRLWAGQLVFNSWQRQEIFLFSIMSRLALGPTQPPI